MLILASPILAGEIKVGAFDQAVVAFRSILIALALVINQFEKLSYFASGVTRLYTLLQKMQTTPALVTEAITFTEASDILLVSLTLKTPDRQTTFAPTLLNNYLRVLLSISYPFIVEIKGRKDVI